MDAAEKRYLELLSHTYPTAADASAQLIQLQARLAAPKPTELYASDVHGEFAAFSHILRNGCGAVRAAVAAALPDLALAEQDAVVTLICYPRRKAAFEQGESAAAAGAADAADAGDAWLATALERLVAVAAHVAAGADRAATLSGLPQDLVPVMELLLAGAAPQRAAALAAAVETGRGVDLLEALAQVIQSQCVSQVHLVGDVYDRGPAPDAIMDELMEHPAVDVQWGNHDVVWMGAALGQRGCIAHVVRNCARYGNLSILEDAYGINLRPLADFALRAYADDPCVAFGLKGSPDLPPAELELNVKIQKAMAILQFKVEAALIDEYPEFGLADRKLLDKIDHDAGTVVVDGVTYELTDRVFPTVDPSDPFALTPDEEAVMESLEQAFTGSQLLQRHMGFFLERGSLYRISNGTLALHACVPLNPDGTLLQTNVFGRVCAGRALYDEMQRYVYAAFDDPDPAMCKRGRDLLWYLWLGPGSPLFAKSKMATFELYLIADKAARKEVKNPFYSLLDDPAVLGRIFADFGMDPATARLICGHVPVKVKDGEDPICADGRVLRIDGGFSAAYQKTTGIAGMTVVSDATGVRLATHQPLESTAAAVERNLDVVSEFRVVQEAAAPLTVAQTDEGRELMALADDLRALLAAYDSGEIQQG
ncbi:MAG: fructose-bisphosphatase class III [Coriobacteriia bacterium]|nr:fructose-bisphosphatase class III [Coriobacteriia bacterium]